MNPFRSNPRRRRKLEFGPEQLETRELLTGGSNTFAIIPGTVSTDERDDRDHSSRSTPRTSRCRGRRSRWASTSSPASGSTIKPLISSVDDPHGDIVPQVFHSIYDPHLGHVAVASNPGHQLGPGRR